MKRQKHLPLLSPPDKTLHIDKLLDAVKSGPRTPDPIALTHGFESRLFQRLHQPLSNDANRWSPGTVSLLGFDIALCSIAMFMLFSTLQDVWIGCIINGWQFSFLYP